MGKITDLLKKVQKEREALKKENAAGFQAELSKNKTGAARRAEEPEFPAIQGVFDFKAPELKDKEESGIHPHIVTYYDYASPVSEQFRAARTHLKSMLKLKSGGVKKTFEKRHLLSKPHVVCLTSSLNSEGKSITSINLAAALSRDIDSKVLMVDCDLRRGSLASYLNVDNKPGLTEILNGKCHYTQAVMPTYISNLFVIPHGKISRHPAELLGSKRMRKLIQELKNENISYIILDTPPLMPFTDGAVAASLADKVFLVVQAQRTRAHILKKSKEQLLKAGVKLSGTILTQAEYYIPDIYGSYYYYRHNRYRYGNVETSEKN